METKVPNVSIIILSSLNKLIQNLEDSKHNSFQRSKMTPEEMALKLPPDSIIIGEKFVVGRTLGEGSFGQIQLGTNIETGDYVAIKIVSTLKYIKM